MTGSVYTRLAREGIRKNRQLYLPFIITASLMVMVTYILGYLSSDECMALIPHGKRTTGAMMDLGMWVTVVFSLIFLLYTYSFIIRRRQKEFGLYNVLGMDKKNLAKIIFRETLMYGFISLAAGLITGVLFSKLFELILVRMAGGEVTYTLRVLPGVMLKTALLFAAIFLIICVIVTVRTGVSSAVTLMNSEKAGEKAPKAAVLPAVLGAVILAAAYFLAVTVNIERPVEALQRFAIAVIMVVISTYLLMIAGSVFLCRVLQKKKSYYYSRKHFVSVSSMAYRMKRNGAGLASICIFATVVLVTVSTTLCMLMGANDTMKRRYPGEVVVRMWIKPEHAGDADTDGIEAEILGAVEEMGGKPEIVRNVKYGSFNGRINGSSIVYEDLLYAAEDSIVFYFLDTRDYGRITGDTVSPGDGEAFILAKDFVYEGNTLSLNGKDDIAVSGHTCEDPGIADNNNGFRVMYVIMNDPWKKLNAFGGEDRAINYEWQYYLNTGLDGNGQIEASEKAVEAVDRVVMPGGSVYYGWMVDARELMLRDVKAGYGGLFFIGVILSGVFLISAVLIIYYKQLSEGYEDRARFDIMQKVGMTGTDIKKSINSQLLTVFFLPLLLAGIHLFFAFPMIREILTLFEIYNTGLFALTTVIVYLIFAALYAAVYKLTSNTYYRIVS